MRRNIIFLNRNEAVYKGVTYDLEDFIDKISNKKKLFISIIGENIYVKVYNIQNNIDLDEGKIEGVISRYFGSSSDYLFNYEISKNKKKLYIYAIRNRGFLGRLCEAPRIISINPIQIGVARICNTIIKSKDYIFIFKYKERYYYIEVEEGFLVEGVIEKSFKDIENILKDKDKNLYIDSYITEEVNGNKISIMKRSVYDEKIC